jgi:hypothetical protein
MRTVYYRSEDKGRGRRAILGFAGSVAVHEIIAGVIILLALYVSPEPKEDKTTAQPVTIVMRHVARPTPPPTPPPTPVPTPHVTPTPRIALTSRVYNAARPKAAAVPLERQGGAAAPLHPTAIAAQHVHAPPVKPAPQRVAVLQRPSVQTGRAQGQANGGTGTGGGAGNGTGGQGGNDSGTGGNGTKPGEDAPLSPCGAVYFDSLRTVTNDDGSQYVQVRVRVQLNDGEELSDTLHWYFYYKSEADNPFMPEHDGERVRMQRPPPGYDLSDNQQPATALALKHTRADGRTDLPDCPKKSLSATSP